MKVEWTNRDNLSIETTSQNSKAILVIDMPTHCGECPVKCRMRGINHVPTWCPLRPLPERKDVPEYLETNRDWEAWGYDQCLAEILGNVATGETE